MCHSATYQWMVLLLPLCKHGSLFFPRHRLPVELISSLRCWAGWYSRGSDSHWGPLHHSPLEIRLSQVSPRVKKSVGLSLLAQWCQHSGSHVDCISDVRFATNGFQHELCLLIQWSVTILSVPHTTGCIFIVSTTNFSSLALTTAANSSSLGSDTSLIGATHDFDVTNLEDTCPTLSITRMYTAAP